MNAVACGRWHASGSKPCGRREAGSGKREIALLWAGFAGAAAAVFAFRHEAEGAVERAVGAEIRIAAHPIGEADEFIGKRAFGLIAFQAQPREADFRAKDFLPDLFGIAHFPLQFIDSRLAEHRIGGELLPCGEEIVGAREDVVIAELFHQQGAERLA